MKIGILDADVYGPSLPKLIDIKKNRKVRMKIITPITKYDAQCMSMGLLVDEQLNDLEGSNGNKCNQNNDPESFMER